jgi:asparagine synthase (glutamine-hydrolysing)
MCGITGFITSAAINKSEMEARVRSMADQLAHRGPDDSGSWADPAAGIAFGFRRLAIMDLSEAGHQPMKSASGRYVIVFNGEVYNSSELGAELKSKGYSFCGHSDTEVMLAAIEEWGLEAAVQRFVGMFAFALWDRVCRTLHLVRDRFGIKPLYYGRVGSDFVFASELKAVRQHPGFGGEIDRDALALFMRLSYIPSPHCIYKGFHKLQPGYILSLKSANSSPSLHRFWSATEVARQGIESPLQLDDEEAIEQLHDQLLAAVRLRMIADVPLGAFLSGGVDSSLVVALMQAQSNRPVKTFTIGFDEDGYDEATYARGVAEHLKTDHTELYLSHKDALDVIPSLPQMYDEPFGDSSQIPTFLVSKLARSSVTVSLSGDGGDEVFGGYNRYVNTRRIWNAVKNVPAPLRRAFGNSILAFPPADIDRTFHALRSVLPRKMQPPAPGHKAHKLADLLGSESPRAIYYKIVSNWDDPTVVVTNSCEPGTVRDLIAGETFGKNIEVVMMLTDTLTYLPDDILTKVDRASMATSLEARVPLLDHRLFEFAWRLPFQLKVRNGTGKWIVRQVLEKYVPTQLIERPKMGFGVPIDSWLRGPLRDWVEELLSAQSLSDHGLLQRQPIRQKWQEHLSGARNWQYLLWNVLSFQDWYFSGQSVRQEQSSAAIS